MKKTILTLLFAGMASVGIADIQAPPSSVHGPIRKFSRAIANIVYGTTEIPTTWSRVEDTEGSSVSATYGLLKGTQKSVARLGYGLYELFTFPFPTYKEGYKAPYSKKKTIYPTVAGYTEFPPQLGFATQRDYNRTQINDL